MPRKLKLIKGAAKKSALVYGMRLFDPSAVSTVDDAQVHLADGSSSRVTMHGPRAFAQSLPGEGPIPVFVAVIWRSRAEKSLKIVTPNRCWGACDASMSRPP